MVVAAVRRREGAWSSVAARLFRPGAQLGGVIQNISIAVTAYRVASRRFGTIGSLAVAGLAVVAVGYLKQYLRREHPEAEEQLDAAL